MQRLESNAAARALELRDLLSQLGPSFVKVGQALSSRPDLLPQVYLEVRNGLTLLLSVVSKEHSQIYILQDHRQSPDTEVQNCSSLLQTCF